jgi:hypothetical protein
MGAPAAIAQPASNPVAARLEHGSISPETDS